ncbi:MAG: CoA pyrophosphatase [Desulfococcaceae bacterium]|jgi:hypothetical protein|nr:CoA pyrophosphatase [Desulfococcaceae bacterium]
MNYHPLLPDTLLGEPEFFRKKLPEILFRSVRPEQSWLPPDSPSLNASAVLFLLGILPETEGDICLILNKRSRKVRQPGDLCCPGGGITPFLDRFLAALLRLPGLHLRSWPCWSLLQRNCPPTARCLAHFLATGLREGWEEMHLHPAGVSLLGPLLPEHLVLFRRAIYPLAVWVDRQEIFRPNREVEKILRLPLRDLLQPVHYATFRLEYPPHISNKLRRKQQDFLCFLFEDRGETEMLWGATFRIVLNFLRIVFDFHPPGTQKLPLIHGSMKKSYLHGRPKKQETLSLRFPSE